MYMFFCRDCSIVDSNITIIKKIRAKFDTTKLDLEHRSARKAVYRGAIAYMKDQRNLYNEFIAHSK